MKIWEAKSASGLIDLISNTLKEEGFEAKQYDIAEAIEFKKALGLETKANEVMHTTNTWFGAELVPGAVQTTDFLDLVPQFSSFIGRLKGFHGRNLNKIQEVSIIGALAKHKLGSEWTTGAGAIKQGLWKLPTDKVTLTQKKYEFSVDVSDEEFRFVNVLDIVATIQKKLARSAAETQEALILNGDTETGATWNINSDDEAPAADNYFLGANGLRKSAFANSGTVDIGTMDFADFISMMSKLGKNATTPQDCIWLFEQSTLTKALGITEFLQAYTNGKSSTVFTGALSNILGYDVLSAYDFPKTEADGKVSFDTPANNVKWGCMFLNTNAVQYWYNGDYNIEVYRIPWQGWQILGYYYMGLATNEKKAGETDNMIALGYNVTL